MAGCPNVLIVSYLVVAFLDSGCRDLFSGEPGSLGGTLEVVRFQ